MNKKWNLINALIQDLIVSYTSFEHYYNKSDRNTLGHDKYWYATIYGNKNYGKTALKRKITYLRQELLNLEELIDRA